MVRSKDLVGFSFFNFIYLFICLFVYLGSFFEELGFQGKGISSPDKNVLHFVEAPIWCGRV
jgi:hypothetical protein